MHLKQFDHNIWTYESPLDVTKGILPFTPPKFLGRPIIRMCVIKKETGGLIIYSPIQMSEEVIKEIKALGPIDLILGSNIFHNTYLVESNQNFQPKKCLVAPKTKKRNPACSELTEWDDSLDLETKETEYVIMKGHIMNEIFLIHQASKTLILTDLLCDMRYGGNFFERIYALYVGVYKKLGVPKYQKLNIKDKAAFLDSMDKVLSYDFDKIILAHGKCILTDGKRIFREVWDNILK